MVAFKLILLRFKGEERPTQRSHRPHPILHCSDQRKPDLNFADLSCEPSDSQFNYLLTTSVVVPIMNTPSRLSNTVEIMCLISKPYMIPENYLCHLDAERRRPEKIK